MKYAEINRIYTDIVSEYIAMGYTINTSTMAGSQGERARIDLEKDGKIVRAMVADFVEDDLQGVAITVGKAGEPVERNTVWNNRLEVILTKKFYEVGETRRTESKIYGTKKEAEQANNKN